MEYQSKLDLIETEIAIKFVKDTFEKKLAKSLNLTRVSAPLFVNKNSGLNDDLNGIEKPVSFTRKNCEDIIEIVQSLAKWKRNALYRYNFDVETGLYTDMNAIRRDEKLDSIHSMYVDQWDWEKIIDHSNRNLNYLKKVVKKIYSALKDTEKCIRKHYPNMENSLASKITFISSIKLLKMYPNLSPKEREYQIVKKYGSVFIYQIGWPLKNGLPHDFRAADYDDWNLNGDILVYDKVMDIALELSSMGIRVNSESLKSQISYKHEESKLTSPYSKSILNNTLPQTIGGGIGQSRLCLFFLDKVHIGEVQASIWDENYLNTLKEKGIQLL